MATRYKYHPGTTEESPILIPIADNRVEMGNTIQFCRRVRVGAPLLVPATECHQEIGTNGRAVTPLQTVARIAVAIRNAAKDRDLTLIPMVAVGGMAGADLAGQLLLLHPSLLSACVLMRPTTPTLHKGEQTLSGINVLLGRTFREETVGSTGWQVCDALTKAGADVICERVPLGSALGVRETAMARVFIAALFGS